MPISPLTNSLLPFLAYIFPPHMARWDQGFFTISPRHVHEFKTISIPSFRWESRMEKQAWPGHSLESAWVQTSLFRTIVGRRTKAGSKRPPPLLYFSFTLLASLRARRQIINSGQPITEPSRTRILFCCHEMLASKSCICVVLFSQV